MDVATLCVALLLCTRARAALPVVREVANEATAALALLSPFLDTQNAALTLYGNASWTGDFLRGLFPHTVRVVLPDTDRFWTHARYNPKDNALILFVSERVTDPWALMQQYGTNIERMLYWFAVQAESVLFTTSEHVYPFMMCGRDAGVAVTTPGGRTSLYSINESKCLTNDRSSRAFELEDRWSPTEQRWQRGGGVFHVFMNFCSGWRPPVPPAPIKLLDIPLAEERSRAAEVLGVVQRMIGDGLGRTTVTTLHVTPENFVPTIRIFLKKVIQTCRLDVCFWGVGGLRRYDPKVLDLLTEGKMYTVQAVVPAGLGPVVSPLSSVALEFSPAVWLGTALAALGTAAALACTLRRDRGAALLLALAPLLAQPPPPPPAAGPALRPLLGVWLLVCVVLAAAYQGLLLGMLSSARPRGEIDSLEALADSGLRVDISMELANLPNEHTNLTKIINGGIGLNVTRSLREIATHRNCALITIEDRFNERMARRLNIPHKRLHRFSIGLSTIKMVAIWSPGSPLATPLISAYRRLDEAGVLDYWDNLVDDLDRHSFRSGVLQHATALTLKHMQPAFLVLLAGYALASVVLVAELLAVRWPHGVAHPVRPAPADAEVRLILVGSCPPARRSASFSCTSHM
ncbi:Glutamate receptor 2 [Frankliniella fusca]|uniref:Glutamate receptor 2 n=1 Tax=Frankliniella fusca TaxID=407009 RepID=A0AAE1HLY4_9NEOP|nr:Glutamate receptor 2 [Frankliniella fusca]